MGKGQIPGFYKLSILERLKKLKDFGKISEDDFKALLEDRHLLSTQRADKMIENVIGVMGLPLGLGLNFLVNDKDYMVPLVVEEPSIVAGLSSAAKVFKGSGGAESFLEESLLIGQVQIVSPKNSEDAKTAILFNKSSLLEKANEAHPRMAERGGGAKDIEVRVFEPTEDQPAMVILHLLVDTCDAMGANVVNTMCESLAHDLEALTEGRVFLRILSNLADRSIVKTKVEIDTNELKGKGFRGDEVRDGVILASQLAEIDPYRAATHNKGIMNGIDPLAIATGNDWRAIEASAHAFAAKTGRYKSLSKWQATSSGKLQGTLEIPLKVGTKGGSLGANETIQISQKLLGITNAKELAELMGAVGLAQNFAALRALATEGIQKGHMSLHSRSVALTAGTPPKHFDEVVRKLKESDEITVTKAKKILEDLSSKTNKTVAKKNEHATIATANGKVILLGEHAVVYGKPAVAVPIKDAVITEISDSDGRNELEVPAWDLDGRLKQSNNEWWKSLQDVFETLGVSNKKFNLRVKPNIPAAVGLGGSAAIAVSIIRCVSKHFKLDLTDPEINDLAFVCETAAHGTASGIDNTIATFGEPLVYQREPSMKIETLKFDKPVSLVIGISNTPSLTAEMVAGVRARWKENTELYEALFENFEKVARSGISAIRSGDYQTLGEMMNINQGLLSAIQVSSPELDRMIEIARSQGAIGAKVTGAGGGGSMVALCEEKTEPVASALSNKGFKVLQVKL